METIVQPATLAAKSALESVPATAAIVHRSNSSHISNSGNRRANRIAAIAAMAAAVVYGLHGWEMGLQGIWN